MTSRDCSIHIVGTPGISTDMIAKVVYVPSLSRSGTYTYFAVFFATTSGFGVLLVRKVVNTIRLQALHDGLAIHDGHSNAFTALRYVALVKD